MKIKVCLIVLALLPFFATSRAMADLVQASTTLPGAGVPEHKYTMNNGANYYVSAALAPTKTVANRAVFAFYAVSGVEGAYYIYNVTAGKWVSYTPAASYTSRTNFLKLSDTRNAATYFKLENYAGEWYQIRPYTTNGASPLFLNWFQGIGAANPLDGNVTLGLWRDNGRADNGSRWAMTDVDQVYEYTVFSSGMPATASIQIFGQSYQGVNAQGDTHFNAATVDAGDVSVTCGGGYLYTMSIDNVNHQINVNFVQKFLPTESPAATAQHRYVLKMPSSYLYKNGENLLPISSKSRADRCIFVEDAARAGRYYIYDVTAGAYVSYRAASIGSTAASQADSRVCLETNAAQAKTWQMRLRDDMETVSILPGELTAVDGASAAWNFTGGVAHGAVLNLWRADDGNSAWEILDPAAGSLACATRLFSLPGKEFMHKLVANAGETVEDVEFDGISTLRLYDDRTAVGNAYKYVYGTAPATTGEYTYSVKVRNAEGEVSTVPVSLTVSGFLQSPTPMMAWLTWNWFARAISHDKIVAIAQGMQDKGLIDAGYNTIVLDDCWATNQSDKARLTYDAVKFPQGISGFKAACQAINGKLKIGIYSDAGSMTCEGYQPGSFGFETQHMSLFDAWGVDMLKYDFCNSEGAAYASYKAMGAAVKTVNDARQAAGKTPFVFNICEWGQNSPWTWGAEAGGSSWRSTADARESWIGNKSRPGVLGGVDATRHLWMYAGVNRFNDLDMMCIGLHGLGGPSNNTADHQSNGGRITGLTDEQARSQMSLWCMLSSPLAITCDLRSVPKAESNTTGGALPNPLVTAADLATLTNADIIRINQDALGQQAEYMAHLSTGTQAYAPSGYDVYVKDLAGGRKAVAVVNRGGAAIASVTLNLAELYLHPDSTYACKEVWSAEEKEVRTTLSTGALQAYQTKVYLLAPKENTTSVSSVALRKGAPSRKYDLLGRTLTEAPQGQVYIENGNKVLK